MFGDVANSNIFTRIFRHSIVHLDLENLLEFKDLKLKKVLNLTLLNVQRRSPIRPEKLQDDYNCRYRVKHFEKIEIFGDVTNSNIFTRIFRYLTIHLDLKDFLEFKDLKFRKLLNLTFLNIQRRSPREVTR
jgi:hypothetical protein